MYNVFTESSLQLYFSQEHGRQLNKYAKVNKHRPGKVNQKRASLKERSWK